MATPTPTPGETTLSQAFSYATAAADASQLPQTLYRDELSMGWWHTNSSARRLQGAQMAQTVLPQRYFS